MNERVPISKKMRFDVFKRDGFQCQYCGSTPPAVVLEIDHIHPVSKGGKNRVDNLLTSCFECNRGKGAGLLEYAPQSIIEKSIILSEKMSQLKAFEKLQRAQRKAEEESINLVEDAFSNNFEGRSIFKDSFRESVRMFLQQIPLYDVVDAMNRACSRITDEQKAIKYFCGICWNKIKEQNNGSF